MAKLSFIGDYCINKPYIDKFLAITIQSILETGQN